MYSGGMSIRFKYNIIFSMINIDLYHIIYISYRKNEESLKKNMGHKNLIIFKLNFRQILSAVNANIWISFFFKNVMVSKNHFTLGKVMEIFFSVHCDTKYCKCKLLL